MVFRGLSGVVMISALGCAAACGGGGSEDRSEVAEPEPKAPEAKLRPAPHLAGPVPTLLVTQARFKTEGGRPVPQPARLSLLRWTDGAFEREDVDDPDSNVFHKAIPYGDGILTIGAQAAPEPATLKLWRPTKQGWEAETWWSRAWEGARFNRLRDLEIGDVTGDGHDNLVIATHDRGVVAVGTRGEEGWSFQEMSETPDTFVHEIEIGDVDGDGLAEFYATPSERNKASGLSQPGSVVRYRYQDGAFVRDEVIAFDKTHAKEILVADVDGDGRDELYVVREAEVVREEGVRRRVTPVTILRMSPTEQGWKQEIVATLEDDQCRFLIAADVTHDGKKELVAAGMKSGLWMLRPGADGQLDRILIDADSGGFEHAIHAADLDRDGKLELYVAADTQKAFRRYDYDGKRFQRTELLPIGPADLSHITWSLGDGKF